MLIAWRGSNISPNKIGNMSDDMNQMPSPGNSSIDAHWLHMTATIGRMDGKIDQILAANVIQKENIEDHEKRIRVLEKGMWKRLGAIGIIGAVGGWVATQLAKAGVFP